MKKMLVTGGTVFVSRYIAEYYVANGYDVYVLNRNSREQSAGVKLIEADRHHLGDILKNYHFNVVVDTAYCPKDIDSLLHSLNSYDDYILISSSAVYPEWCRQPFSEDCQLGANKYWGKFLFLIVLCKEDHFICLKTDKCNCSFSTSRTYANLLIRC